MAATLSGLREIVEESGTLEDFLSQWSERWVMILIMIRGSSGRDSFNSNMKSGGVRRGVKRNKIRTADDNAFVNY